MNTQITVWNLTVQNCWLHDIGLAGYLGSPGHVQQIINLVWQHNLIEKTYGYGVQVKAQNVRSGLTLGTTPGLEFTSWGWLIKDNVWMRTSPPAQTGRPNLLVDAGPASGVGSTDLATIEGNVVLAQTADATADNAFQLSGNLRVVNNILMNYQGRASHPDRLPRHHVPAAGRDHQQYRLYRRQYRRAVPVCQRSAGRLHAGHRQQRFHPRRHERHRRQRHACWPARS